MSIVRRRPLLAAILLVTGFGCISSEVDPRCTISTNTASREYQAIVAQCINASPFWKAYFDEIEKSSPGQALIDFRLHMEREVTGRSDGDYDPGNVSVRLIVTNLRNRRSIYDRKAEVRIEDVIYGNFGPNPTREEIQKKAFEATEAKIYPHLEIWINIAALRAMSQEKAAAEAFLPILEEAAANPWGDEIPGEANTALQRLTGARSFR